MPKTLREHSGEIPWGTGSPEQTYIGLSPRYIRGRGSYQAIPAVNGESDRFDGGLLPAANPTGTRRGNPLGNRFPWADIYLVSLQDTYLDSSTNG